MEHQKKVLLKRRGGEAEIHPEENNEVNNDEENNEVNNDEENTEEDQI